MPIAFGLDATPVLAGQWEAGNMTADRRTNGNDLPVSWVSLFRTARAPLAVLLLAAAGLIIPPQTDDMLAALSDGGKFARLPSFFFQLSLAVLSVSAWYWARIQGTRADRRKLLEHDKRINPFALAAVLGSSSFSRCCSASA